MLCDFWFVSTLQKKDGSIEGCEEAGGGKSMRRWNERMLAMMREPRWCVKS